MMMTCGVGTYAHHCIDAYLLCYYIPIYNIYHFHVLNTMYIKNAIFVFSHNLAKLRPTTQIHVDLAFSY